MVASALVLHLSYTSIGTGIQWKPLLCTRCYTRVDYENLINSCAKHIHSKITIFMKHGYVVYLYQYKWYIS